MSLPCLTTFNFSSNLQDYRDYSEHCRGHIDTNTDWKRPDLQERYEGQFLNYVQSQIDALAA